MNSARRIIAKFGTQTRFAELLGLRQSTVQHWAKTGAIPAKWQQKILDMATQLGVSVSPAEFAAVTIRG